jgi:multicomponent Na+:H+ antiporter subunit A
MIEVQLTALLPLVALATPVALLVGCLFGRLRDRMPAALGFASVPALAAAVFAVDGPPLVLEHPSYRMTLSLDRPGAMLLGVAALLWTAAGFCAPAFLRGKPDGGRFTVCWLLTLTGSLGIFTADDLASFFIFYALVSLPAYGLVVQEATTAAQRAGALYLAFALLGETLLLMGFVLLAVNSQRGSLLIADVMAALPASPWQNITLALLISGFGMKIGLVPLHFWMPLTYAAAPIPAAAVLSGAAVKAGVIGLIRFLPLGVALPGWGGALAAAGLFAGFYGVAIGITQSNPKTVLAYSSVSQMGFIATVLGMAQAAGDSGAASYAAFYAAHHLLVKGALFLAVGVVASASSRRTWLVVLPATIIALGLGGLPLTGGAQAKLAVKGILGEGLAGVLATFSAAGTALLMLHFLRRLVLIAKPDSDRKAPAGLVLPWLAMAAASVVVPWALSPLAGLGSFFDALAPAVLWQALWPVLVGAVLAIGLRFWGHRLPRVPAGDLIVTGRGAARAVIACGAALERADDLLSQWAVAGLSLLAVAILLAMAMLAGG